MEPKRAEIGMDGFREPRGMNIAAAVSRLSVALCFFLYAWLQVDPSLQFHTAGPVFFFGSEFFKGFVGRPGGITEYAAAFLAQFHQVAWLGALCLTLGASGFVVVTRWLLQRAAESADPTGQVEPESRQRPSSQELAPEGRLFRLCRKLVRKLRPDRPFPTAVPTKVATKFPTQVGTHRSEGKLSPELFSMGPIFLLLLLQNNYDYPAWQTMLGLLLALSFVLGYTALPLRNAWLRLAMGWFGSLLLWHTAGAGPCFLFAVLGALFECLPKRPWDDLRGSVSGRRVPPHPGPLPQGEGMKPPVNRKTVQARLVEPQRTVLPLPRGEGRGEGEASAVYPAASSTTRRPYLFGVGLLCLAGSSPFAGGVLLEASLTDHFKLWGKGPSMWLTLALYVLVPLAMLFQRRWASLHSLAKEHRSPEHPMPARSARRPAARVKAKSSLVAPQPHDYGAGWLRPGLTVGLLALTAATAFLTFDSNRKALLQVDLLAEQGKWDEVLKVASHVRGYKLSTFLCLDRALFHTGRMARDLFAFHQVKGLDLLPGLDRGLGHCRALSATLLELGQVNLAEHFAYEALELEGDRPALLWQLARINILKDRPRAARIFLNVLRKIPFQRVEADRWMKELETDLRLTGQKDLARIRRWKAGTDLAESHLPTAELLEQLLQTNRQNRMAFEYLMAHYLLTFQLDKFTRELDRLNDFDFPVIPRHYEEAILLRQRLKTEAKIDLRGRPIDPKTTRQFEQFQAQLDRYRNRRDEAGAALAEDFGNTYWYYFFFARAFGQKASALQETEQ
ncbi:MAG: hypothetical protein HY735_12710 [Verrucomicrobia bacterium]|nr:hypothetical protein [Verrucomicrobiota bacterium]